MTLARRMNCLLLPYMKGVSLLTFVHVYFIPEGKMSQGWLKGTQLFIIKDTEAKSHRTLLFKCQDTERVLWKDEGNDVIQGQARRLPQPLPSFEVEGVERAVCHPSLRSVRLGAQVHAQTPQRAAGVQGRQGPGAHIRPRGGADGGQAAPRGRRPLRAVLHGDAAPARRRLGGAPRPP